MIEVPKPKTVKGHDGHFTATYGTDVIEGNEVFSSSIGVTIASMAEAERHLEAVFKSVCGGNGKILTALLATFRGHKQLLSAVSTALEASKDVENFETFEAIRAPVHQVWEVRDNLAHGIWVRSSDHPSAALRVSAKVLGRLENDAKDHIASGDFAKAFAVYDDYDAEIWTEREFKQAAAASKGVVNSLIAFSACIARSPEEASELHSALRSQGLLNNPPWKLRTPTQPPESDSTH